MEVVEAPWLLHLCECVLFGGHLRVWGPDQPLSECSQTRVWNFGDKMPDEGFHSASAMVMVMDDESIGRASGGKGDHLLGVCLERRKSSRVW
jgi:hypothetical protein